MNSKLFLITVFLTSLSFARAETFKSLGDNIDSGVKTVQEKIHNGVASAKESINKGIDSARETKNKAVDYVADKLHKERTDESFDKRAESAIRRNPLLSTAIAFCSGIAILALAFFCCKR